MGDNSPTMPDSPGGERGHRHPTREFTGIGDFGQFGGADSKLGKLRSSSSESAYHRMNNSLTEA